jgi:acetoin utilization protein AcuC
MKTAIIYHDDFKKYDFGSEHPFRGDRYKHLSRVFGHEAIMARKSDISFIKPKPATDSEIAFVHGGEYIKFIEFINKDGGMLTLDTPIPAGLYQFAKLFAGANILAGRLIAEDIFKRAVVLGLGAHHAGYDFGGGFCMINDIAVMIQYLKEHYHVKKIMTIDYDAHCGDGTQDIYYRDSDVLCIDFHQDPMTLFPGKGFYYQIGLEKGKGYTVNLPFPKGATEDHYIAAFNEICLPIANEYKPEIIIAVGSLDAHFADPLSQLNISLNGFFQIMKLIVNLSRQLCDNKMILILGGGYGPTVVPLGWIVAISAMLEIIDVEISEPMNPPEYSKSADKESGDMIEKVKMIQSRYWKNL